ncbi:MAG: extracellular solute-binding protein [Hyphomicrobiales bacterium]
MKKILIATVALTLAAFSAAQAQETTLRLHYAIPNLWKTVQEKIAQEFMARNPDIKIVLDAPAKTYADGVQQLLREAVAKKLPDLAYVGLNRWRILEARKLIVNLDPLIGDAKEFEAKGYTPALRSLGQYKGEQYAVAASASTLVVYVNPELVKRAGGSMEKFPKDFDSLIALAAKISSLGNNIDGVWVAAHDWRFQSMLGSYGGRPMNEDETAITFDSQAGIKAATLYARFAKEAGMKKYGGNEARQAFAAGILGIYIDSSSYLTRMIEGAGDRFKVTVTPLIVAAQDKKSVYFPTGGSAIVIITRDKAKQAAAWKYILFATGPEGAKIVVENSGYAPTNAIVLQDKKYLGDFYAKNENSRRAHAQVAAYSGPWYSYPGSEGVAVTDQIGAALVEIIDGASPEATIKELAKDVRAKLRMK